MPMRNITENWADIEEVFRMRANELDSSGVLANRRDLLWELIKGGGIGWDTLISVFPGGRSFRDALVEDMLKIYQEVLRKEAALDDQYAEHIDQLTIDIDAGRKLLLIAHLMRL